MRIGAMNRSAGMLPAYSLPESRTIDSDQSRLIGRQRFKPAASRRSGVLLNSACAGARLCEPQQAPKSKVLPFVLSASCLAKLLRVADPRSSLWLSVSSVPLC